MPAYFSRGAKGLDSSGGDGGCGGGGVGERTGSELLIVISLLLSSYPANFYSAYRRFERFAFWAFIGVETYIC